MKKYIAFLTLSIALFGSATLQAQKYKTRTGTIAFEASVPSFEEVAASNNQASSIVDADQGTIAVLALMKGFRFEVALMEEHFNENYVDSDTYPKATFKGKIADFNAKKLNATPTTYTISGQLTLHGVTKPVTSTATISKEGDALLVKGSFTVTPEDFNIDIPGIVSEKIAKDISVSYQLPLKP